MTDSLTRLTGSQNTGPKDSGNGWRAF